MVTIEVIKKESHRWKSDDIPLRFLGHQHKQLTVHSLIKVQMTRKDQGLAHLIVPFSLHS